MSETSPASGRTIKAIRAREVLDCRGLPTVQVDVELEGGVIGTADVPSGRSTGSNEARELRDGGDRFGGFGVRGAVDNVIAEITPALVGRPLADQRALDASLIELDGTPDKSRLGANAILGVSLAAARGRAAANGMPLYRALNANSHVLPVPLVNLINGGKHASNDLDFQEFIVIPTGADSILEALQISTEVNLALAEILLERYGKSALNTGDEGGYAPAISSPQEALGLLHEAVANAGHEGRFRYGLDCAATHYYDAGSRTYALAGETRDTDAMIELYLELIRDYDVITIEDPLDEEDFEGFASADRRERHPDRRRRPLRHRSRAVAPRDRRRGGQRAALEGQPDRHPLGGDRRRRPGAPQRLQGGRLGALGRDRGPDHRRPRRRARGGPDQDRRPRPRRADREVQPADPDRRGAGRDRDLPGVRARRHRRSPPRRLDRRRAIRAGTPATDADSRRSTSSAREAIARPGARCCGSPRRASRPATSSRRLCGPSRSPGTS